MTLEKLKKTLKSNISIFVLGLALLTLFLGIIAVSNRKTPVNTPNLIKVEEQPDTPEEFPEAEAQEEIAKPYTPESTESLSIPQTPFDERYGVITITFDGSSFNPRLLQAESGQLVRWINNSKNVLSLGQTKKIYQELMKPVEIAPGQVFEMRIIHPGMFGYMNSDKEQYGGIMVTRTLYDD